MLLREYIPDLPEDEGRFWTHRSGGEHAQKFSGAEVGYNYLRDAYLRDHGGEAPAPIPTYVFNDMLFDPNKEVIIIHRHDLRNDSGAAEGIIAGAIASSHVIGRFEKKVTVDEMVVHPDLRMHGLASFMLDRATRSEVYGTGEPTELVVNTSRHQMDDQFRDKLVGSGFRHLDEDGSPALWLPGNTVYRGDRDDPEVVEGLLAGMPADWNGYHTFYPDSDLQFQVFRAGKLVGIARPDEGSGRLDDRDYVYDFELTDAAGNEIGRASGLTDRQALIALMNNYQLLD